MIQLKEAIKENHDKAEKMPFNIKMFKGELSKHEYLNHLIQQHAIFNAIEKVGLPSPVLARVNLIKQDIKELENELNISQELLTPTIAYVNHLEAKNYEQILPHIYLNYLALLYGGQFIKKKVPSSGMMYQFESKKEAMLAVRDLQKDEWANEVNKGFEYLINIFKALE